MPPKRPRDGVERASKKPRTDSKSSKTSSKGGKGAKKKPRRGGDTAAAQSGHGSAGGAGGRGSKGKSRDRKSDGGGDGSGLKSDDGGDGAKERFGVGDVNPWATRGLAALPPRVRMVPLGAAQEVGRSCHVVEVGGARVLLDCGMHLGYGVGDKRRFPDFRKVSRGRAVPDAVDCVVVTHFHLDHCGALPMLTEGCGYSGPVLMTHPTRSMCAIMLEDYRKVVSERYGEAGFYTSEDIVACLKKVTPMHLHETVVVGDGIEVTAYYAGHVLGAAMISISCGGQTVVYSGDFNMTPDSHLGPARIPKLRPDMLITESTYGSSTRKSQRSRDEVLLAKLGTALQRGGNVLLPVFAVGRAQELTLLVMSYLKRANIRARVYCTPGMSQRANEVYRLHADWCSGGGAKADHGVAPIQRLGDVEEFTREMINQPGPQVVFATPGMLAGGLSLDIFRAWCSKRDNMVILPGRCLAGTVGAQLQAGKIEIEDTERGGVLQVSCSVESLGLSGHADAAGVLQLIHQLAPRNVVLVHGERGKMMMLRDKISESVHLPCYMPAEGESVDVATSDGLPAFASHAVHEAAESAAFENLGEAAPVPAVLLAGNGAIRLMSSAEATAVLGKPPFRFSMRDSATEL